MLVQQPFACVVGLHVHTTHNACSYILPNHLTFAAGVPGACCAPLTGLQATSPHPQEAGHWLPASERAQAGGPAGLPDAEGPAHGCAL
jgi:hypothetical protein